MSTAMQPTRPVLRWHGGKYLLAPWIISHFGPHRVYVEPYGGAASVLLQKAPAQSEVFNDIDDELFVLFKVLRDPEMSDELSRMLKLTLYSRAEFEAAYFPSPDPVESSRRLIIRSFMGIGVSKATARSGRKVGRPATGYRSVLEPNCDLRARGWVSYVDALDRIKERLRTVLVENLPALECIKRYDTPHTLFYLDPPYPKGTRGDTGDDYSHEMTDGDHEKLAEINHSLKAMVVLSGYPCALYDGLYGDWMKVKRKALADGAKPRTEVLWLNRAAAEAMPQRGMF